MEADYKVGRKLRSSGSESGSQISTSVLAVSYEWCSSSSNACPNKGPVLFINTIYNPDVRMNYIITPSSSFQVTPKWGEQLICWRTKLQFIRNSRWKNR